MMYQFDIIIKVRDQLLMPALAMSKITESYHHVRSVLHPTCLHVQNRRRTVYIHTRSPFMRAVLT